MLRDLLAAVALVGVAGTANAGVEYPPWPKDAKDDTDSRVVAYYQAYCSDWAGENGHQGEALTQYMAFCMQQMPVLRPVALFIIVINSIKSFQVFVEIFVMTKGKFDTSTVVYFIYETGLQTRFKFGYASAAAYLLFVIIGLFSILQFVLMRRRQTVW